MTNARQILEDFTASSFLDPKKAAKCFSAGRCFRDALSGQPRHRVCIVCGDAEASITPALPAVRSKDGELLSALWEWRRATGRPESG
jgi:hypothetical protein